MYKLISLLLFIVLVIFLRYFAKQNQEKWTKEQLKGEFKGVATRKLQRRSHRIYILQPNGKVFDINVASDCLFNSVVIGDTITKLANSNKCLVKSDTTFECDCYYFP